MPSTSDAPLHTERPPWGYRVEGPVPPPAEYEPDTPEFLHYQLAAALDRARSLWSRLLPDSGAWIPGTVLPAVPIEGEGLNAFYDREAIRFFRGENPETGELVHSGDSPDIVAHEHGHAVLDSVRPDLWDAPHFEVAAFHEAFGDVASILLAFDEPVLARAVLEETRGQLARSNLVSRVAEELASAARARFGPGVALPGALRDAVNGFHWQLPETLPSSAPAEEVSAEPHSFCRVLTGAWWDALVALYDAAGGGSGDTARDVKALERAAREAGRLFTAAARSAPPGARYFSRVVRRIVRAASPDAAETLQRVFARRDLPADDPADRPAAEDLELRGAPAGEHLPEGLVRAVHKRLGRGFDGEILLRPSPAEGVLRGRRRRDLVLHGSEYGPADGAAVEISDSFSLRLDSAGFVVASAFYPARDEEAEDARAFVRFLARTGRIAGETEQDSSTGLFRKGTSHVVLREEDGVRRVRRVWIDS